MNVPRLIAHRGYAHRYPENTLPAMEAALRVGAPCVEFDVQLSADTVPVVLHDATLERTTTGRGAVFEQPADMLARLDAGEPTRFGSRFHATALPTLASMVELLRGYPGVTAFVELKRASLEHFGVETVLRRVQTDLVPIARDCVIISFEADAVAAARMFDFECGWIFEDWSDTSRRQAERLAPAYLFTDYSHIPVEPGLDTGKLWSGPWQWALYDIVDPDLALRWAGHGVGFVETSAIGEMLTHPMLGRGRRREARL